MILHTGRLTILPEGFQLGVWQSPLQSLDEDPEPREAGQGWTLKLRELAIVDNSSHQDVEDESSPQHGAERWNRNWRDDPQHDGDTVGDLQSVGRMGPFGASLSRQERGLVYGRWPDSTVSAPAPPDHRASALRVKSMGLLERKKSDSGCGRAQSSPWSRPSIERRGIAEHEQHQGLGWLEQTTRWR